MNKQYQNDLEIQDMIRKIKILEKKLEKIKIKIHNMFETADGNKVIDDLLEIEKIIEEDYNEEN